MKSEHSKQIYEWFETVVKTCGGFETPADDCKARQIYHEVCEMAYMLGRENREAWSEVFERYRLLHKGDINNIRLEVAKSAMQGILARMPGMFDYFDEIRSHKESVDKATELAVYAADSLIKRLMDSPLKTENN